MTILNLASSRFVLKSLLEELEAFDRDIPVVRNIQSGDVADAILVLLNNREVSRLMTQNARASHGRVRTHGPSLRAAAKRKSKLSRSA
jgi:hypothetical protein